VHPAILKVLSTPLRFDGPSEGEEELLRELAGWKGLWVRPMDIGAHSHSRHSAILARLCKKGWAERRSRHLMSDVSRQS
jgi:hypothetical protein